MCDIAIALGLLDEHLEQAVTLYCKAFHQKLAPVFRDESLAQSVLRDSLNPDYAIVALHEGCLVGIAGFKDSEGTLVDIQPKTMTRAFGWFGGWIRLFGLALWAGRCFTEWQRGPVQKALNDNPPADCHYLVVCRS
jgi:hypothetical protein